MRNTALVQALVHASRMDPVDDLTDVIGKILVPDISHRNLYKIAVSRHPVSYTHLFCALTAWSAKTLR